MSRLRESFQVVHARPSVIALEIAWRWSFGSIATALLLLGTRALLGGLAIAPGDEEALHGSDPTRIFAALMHVFQQPGVWQRFLLIGAAIVVPTAAVWTIAATLGRVAVMNKILGAKVDAAVILVFNIARVAILFGSLLLWYAWMFACAWVTMQSDPPNYPLYVLLSFLALPFIAVLWGMLNWLLSLAPVLAREHTGALQTFRETWRLARSERRSLMAETSWLGIPRLIAMIALLIVAIIVLVAVQSAMAAGIAVTVITLIYCAFADYLYVVRLAAYGQIADKRTAAQAN